MKVYLVLTEVEKGLPPKGVFIEGVFASIEAASKCAYEKNKLWLTISPWPEPPKIWNEHNLELVYERLGVSEPFEAWCEKPWEANRVLDDEDRVFLLDSSPVLKLSHVEVFEVESNFTA